MAERGMAAFKRAPEALSTTSFCLDVSRVVYYRQMLEAELGELPTGELAATVHAKTSRSPYAVHVGQETFDVFGGI